MKKSSTEKGANWGSLGGNHGMHKWSGTGTQEPGQSAQEGSGSKSGIAPKAGPSGLAGSGQTNKDYAGTQSPGHSGSCKEGGDAKFAEGGKTSMFGNRGSRAAIPGQTSQ